MTRGRGGRCWWLRPGGRGRAPTCMYAARCGGEEMHHDPLFDWSAFATATLPCPPPPPRPPYARSQIGFLPHAAHLRPLLEEHNDSGGVRVHVRVRSDPDGVARGQDRGGGKRSTKNGQIPVAVTVQATPSFIHLVHACLEAADLAPLPGTGLCAPPRMPPWCVALKPRTPLGALLRTYCSCRRGEGPIHTNMPRC